MGIFKEDVVNPLDLLENAPVGIAACDLDAYYIFANKAYARIYGYSPEELIGKTFIEVKTPADKREVQLGLLRELLRKGEVIGPFVKKDLTRSGEEIYVEYHGDYVYKNGKRIGAIVFIKDVTERERRNLEIELEKEKLKIDERLKLVGSMVPALIHDLNNFLTVIIGYNQLSKGRYSEYIGSSAILARDLAKNVLSLSRSNSVSRESLCLQTLVSEVAEFLGRVHKAKDRIKISMESQASWVMGSDTDLRSAFANLIINAIHATSEKGEIEIFFFQSNEEAFVRISDTGCGIPKELQKRIFEPFFSTKGSSGNGLGMCSIKRYIEENHGNIAFNSEYGFGTTFHIIFPLTKEPKSIVKSSYSDFSLQDLLICVMEPDQEVSKTYLEVLKINGAKCFLFSDYDLFRKSSLVHNSDLIILDAGFPGMVGLDVLSEMRKNGTKVPVILTSAYRVDHLRDYFVGDPKSDSLMKPFNLRDLKQKISSLIMEKENVKSY